MIWRRRAACVAVLLAVVPAVAVAAGPAENEARRVLARFEAEPTVNEVQAAALDYAMMSPEVLGSMRSRSRYAAVLPKLKLRVQKDIDEDSRSVLDVDTDNDGTQESLTGTDDKTDALQLRAEAEWKLNEMIFNSRETSVVKEIRSTARERQRLLEAVTKAYFARRRSQVDLLLQPPSDGVGRAMAELKIAELTSELDALTGGSFSRMVAARQ